MAGKTSLIGIAARALRRPRLLLALPRAAWRFRRRGWWRRFPFLPIPPAEYVEWRLHTAYGESGRGPSGEEMERYVRWANRMNRSRGGAGRP